jgi:uncharacterized membrane protein SpoIIM required for sporulation
VIVDLKGFVQRERPTLEELEAMLDRMERNPHLALTVAEVERLDYLYHRAGAALVKLESLPVTQGIRRHFDHVVARAYAELRGSRAVRGRIRPWRWFVDGIPAVVQRHVAALALSVVVTLLGAAFGAYAVHRDLPDAKQVLFPFSALHEKPAERVAREERGVRRALEAHQAAFAAQLTVNNVRVSITAMAFGVFWGVGTLILLLYNGIILGAVVFDYVRSGQAVFVAGWLMPHGSVEIPAILLAGQAGLVLGGALLGWGTSAALRERLERVLPDLVSLIFGVAVLLLWAGLVESFLSQYHEPTVPYWAKIAFGVGELALLGLWLLPRRRSSGDESSSKPAGWRTLFSRAARAREG